MSEREALVAMVDAAMVEMQNISPPLRRSECERLIKAALTAQQEPVTGRCVAPPCKCSEEKRTVCAYWHSAPPSGVREEDDIDAHNKDWFETLARAEAITRAAEQVNAEGHTRIPVYLDQCAPSAPTPQPADGVVVPKEPTDAWAEKFCELVNWHPDGSEGRIVEGIFRETTFRDLAKGYIRAMLAAAKEPR